MANTTLSELQKVVLGVVKNIKGEVLIVQRAKEEKGTDGVKLSWAFPGGKVEAAETKDEAIIREVLEETGYKVKASFIISERPHPQFPVYIYYFSCDLETEAFINKPTDTEVEQVKWVNPNELKNIFTTDIDKKVLEYLKEK